MDSCLCLLSCCVTITISHFNMKTNSYIWNCDYVIWIYDATMPVTFVFGLLVRYQIVSLQPRALDIGEVHNSLSWVFFYYKVILSGSGFVPNICFIWDKVPEVAWWKVWAIWLIYLRWSAVLITMHLHICCGRPNIPRVCTRESNKKDKPSFVTKFAFKCISLCYRYRNQKKTVITSWDELYWDTELFLSRWVVML
jgi:hypothetical protein